MIEYGANAHPTSPYGGPPAVPSEALYSPSPERKNADYVEPTLLFAMARADSFTLQSTNRSRSRKQTVCLSFGRLYQAQHRSFAPKE